MNEKRLRPHSAGSTLPHLWPTCSSSGSPPSIANDHATRSCRAAQASRSRALEGNKGKGGGADLAARRRNRADLCAQADRSRHEGDRPGPSKERRNGARTIRSSPSIRGPNPVQTWQRPLTSQTAAAPRAQSLRAAEPRSRRSSNCCSVVMVRLSSSLSPPPAGCRTRRGPR